MTSDSMKRYKLSNTRYLVNAFSVLLVVRPSFLKASRQKKVTKHKHQYTNVQENNNVDKLL